MNGCIFKIPPAKQWDLIGFYSSIKDKTNHPERACPGDLTDAQLLSEKTACIKLAYKKSPVDSWLYLTIKTVANKRTAICIII